MNKIIIISSHPAKGLHTHKESALASFNKNLINKLKSTKLNFIILADNDNKNDNAVKAWKKNDLFSFVRLIKLTAKYKDRKKILIQYEWNLFGSGIIFIILFIFFILTLKILNKKVFIVLHGVNFDFTPIFGKNIKSYFFNFGSWIFYYFIVLISNKIVVNEEKFKRQLQKKYSIYNKIIFIPHGVEKKEKIKLHLLKQKKVINLGFLGFINPYKGPLELLELLNKINNKNYSLTFYGGVSKNLLKDKNYQEYLNKFYTIAHNSNIKITGFLNEKEINKVFNSIDIVIFPYKIFLSSSGMLALTFSFEKPFILSRPLEGYFESPDFKEALRKTGLKKEDFLFDFNKESLEKRLEWAKNNLEKLSRFSRLMKQKRSWEKVTKTYLKVLKES